MTGKGFLYIGLICVIVGLLTSELISSSELSHLKQYDIKIYLGKFFIIYGSYFLLIGILAYFSGDKGENNISISYVKKLALL